VGKIAVPARTHHTAVVAIPPNEVWESLQAIRREYDRQFRRWMPHVSLLYPFRPEKEFEEAGRAVAQACAGQPPITTVLSEFRYFVHPSGTTTLWLSPEPGDAYVSLQAALQAVFPDCRDQSRSDGGFTPHLSVGQAGLEESAEKLCARLQANWTPVRFVLQDVALIRRDVDTPFDVALRIPLGGQCRN
jgi:2'-5' RNA ligase